MNTKSTFKNFANVLFFFIVVYLLFIAPVLHFPQHSKRLTLRHNSGHSLPWQHITRQTILVPGCGVLLLVVIAAVGATQDQQRWVCSIND